MKYLLILLFGTGCAIAVIISMIILFLLGGFDIFRLVRYVIDRFNRSKRNFTEHDIKIWKKYFNDVSDGTKPFEVRFNDRDYKVGDILNIWAVDSSFFTGRVCSKIVTYVLDDSNFCKEGYVILGLKDYNNHIKVNVEN